jgi:glycosyltransferase involved in cell wall biosynthesis
MMNIGRFGGIGFVGNRRPVLKILMVGNFLTKTRGGSRQVGEELASRLPARGVDVITTSSISPKVFRLLDMLVTAWRFRRDYDGAIVEVFSGAAFVWAFAVCSLLRSIGKPYILSLHGGGLAGFAKKRTRLVRQLLDGASAITAPSQYLAQELSSFRSDIRVIPNAIDISRYPYRARSPAEPRLVWLRAFHEVYNPGLAVQVVSELAKTHPDSTLIMAGPEKDGSRLKVERDIEARGIKGVVEVVGAVPKSEVPTVLSQGDVFLNTTYVDNAPTTVIEAMACGLCVVSTDVGGIPTLLKDRETGLLVPPDDPDAMVSAVQELLQSSDLAGRLSKQAREAVEGFDWPMVLDQWMDLICDLVGLDRRR